MQPEVRGSCSDYLTDAALKKEEEEEKGGKVRQTNGDLSLTLQGELYSTHTCRETSLNSVCVCVCVSDVTASPPWAGMTLSRSEHIHIN